MLAATSVDGEFHPSSSAIFHPNFGSLFALVTPRFFCLKYGAEFLMSGMFPALDPIEIISPGHGGLSMAMGVPQKRWLVYFRENPI